MGDEDYIASVGLTAGSYAPRNTALCQGQLVAIAQNTALFYLLNKTYGGNGVANFALPNLTGSTVIGTGPQPGTGASWTLGQSQAQLTQLSWPEGNPAATPAGGTSTIPIPAGPAGLALNWAITLIGIFPPHPDGA